MTVVPLGLGRSSVALQSNRAYSSLASTKALLGRYEQQVLTERQYQYGSDSPFNAAATLTVQAIKERKTQNVSNIQTTQHFLAATDSTLSQFNALTDEAQQAALSAINTLTSPGERAALAEKVNQTIKQLFNFGNYSYEGRYVFSGSTTGVLPFLWGEGDSYSVKYNGVETNVQSWSDTDLLSKTNVNGSELFGAISAPVRGTTDLNPAANSTTRLSDLNGGKGVEKGAIRLTYSDGNQTKTLDIDLSRCTTLADIKRTIENNSSSYFNVKVGVEITSDSINLTLPPDAAGTVSVSEVGKGKVARQLGIPLNTPFSTNRPLIGTDFNPALTNTTLLSDILGTKSKLALTFSGANNDIIIQSQHNGGTLNGLNITLQSDPAVAPGSEAAQYDAATNSVFVRINPENTTANNIIAAINTAAQNDPDFPAITATASGDDQTQTSSVGAGTVPLLAGTSVSYGSLASGSGTDFDFSGLQLVNGNKTQTVSFADCTTVGDLLAELNSPEYGLCAEINETKNGINVRSRVSGADFCIGENGGITASQLGIRTTDYDTLLAELDYGRGVNDYEGPGTAAFARYDSVTPNSGLLLTARNEGTAWNGYNVNFIPTQDPDGRVTVLLDETTKTVCIGINPGVTKACDIVTAFAELPGPKQYFDLTLDTTSGLNDGSGVVYDGFAKTANGTDGGIDFVITRNDGVQIAVDIHGAETIGDILRLINEHPENTEPKIIASLVANGNGIELQDASTGNYVTRVDRTLLSTAAIELGLIDDGQEYRAASFDGTEWTWRGNDPNPKETESIYNALIRLQLGMENNDSREMERASQLLSAAVDKMNSSRATLGTMQNSLESVAVRLSEEQVQYAETLNNTLYIDYADASLSYLGQQLSYQGSMQITGMMLQMSLLNYL
ncbi:hypothetical protein FACS189443_2090 [Planctomycetales bacterium]|nr:hypothetical protein FACS189443_2090 [Planctomycetales bacterium]